MTDPMAGARHSRDRVPGYAGSSVADRDDFAQQDNGSALFVNRDTPLVGWDI
jgi:hypothetical protein